MGKMSLRSMLQKPFDVNLYYYLKRVDMTLKLWLQTKIENSELANSLKIASKCVKDTTILNIA